MTTNDSLTPKKAESGIQDSPLSAAQSLINLSSSPQVVQGQTARDGRRHSHCHDDPCQDSVRAGAPRGVGEAPEVKGYDRKQRRPYQVKGDGFDAPGVMGEQQGEAQERSGQLEKPRCDGLLLDHASRRTTKRQGDSIHVRCNAGAELELALGRGRQNPKLCGGAANGAPADQHAARHWEHHHEPLPGLHPQAIQTKADRDENHEHPQVTRPEIGGHSSEAHFRK